MNWPEIQLIVVLVLFTRLFPRLINPEAISTDSYYHLLCAESIRQHRFRIPERIKGFCFPSPYDYPPLFHYLLALFPKPLREKTEMWISGILDLGNVLAFFWLAVLLDHLIWNNQGPPPLIVTMLFAVSPALLFAGAGPRAYQATPRVLGELCFNLCVIGAFIHIIEGGWIFAAVSIFFAALVFLGSKFSIQALIFMFPVMGLMLKSLFLASVPIFGFVVAALFSRGFCLKIVRGQLGHLTLFAKWTAKHYPNVLRKNRWRDIMNLPGFLLKKPAEAYRVIFLDNSYLILLFRHPQLLVLAYLAIHGFAPSGEGDLSFLWAWGGASLFAFSLTSFRPLLFLGEPERYAEHGVMPLYLLAAYGAWIANSFLPFCSVVSSVSLFLYAVYVVAFVRLSRMDENMLRRHEEVFTFLRKWPDKLCLLPIGSIYGLAYHSGQDVFYSSGNFATCYRPIHEFKQLYKILGLPREDLSGILRQYDLDGVVAFKNAVKDAQASHGISYNFSGLNRVFENTSCEIWLRTHKSEKSQNGAL